MADSLEQANKEIASLLSQLESQKGYVQVAHYVIHELKQAGSAISQRVRPEDGKNIGTIAAKYVRMGKDFDTLMTHIKKDVMLQSEWKRFCIMLRLAE